MNEGNLKIRFITSNKKKAEEMTACLAPRGIRVEQRNIGYIEIQSDSLEEVVRHGLVELKSRGEDMVLIEDSGLFIEALGEFPGVYSAQVYRAIGCSGVLKLLDGTPNRKALFKAVMGVLWNGEPHIVYGECWGEINREERGTGGFGYDPVFIPVGDSRTFAEMTVKEKGRFSHRARAIESLLGLFGGIA